MLIKRRLPALKRGDGSARLNHINLKKEEQEKGKLQSHPEIVPLYPIFSEYRII